MRNLLLAVFFAALNCLAGGAALGAAPIPEQPWVGTWIIALRGGSCHEIYRLRADGTMLVTSAEEVAESKFQISSQPNENGFYKMVDTITKDNGKKDCSGQVTVAGRTVTQFIRFHPSGNMFLMCEEDALEKCIGWFVRQKGLDS